jgi:hypothetical protein
MLLGSIVTSLNELKEQNKQEHEKIFKRLDDGEQYLLVLKLSRCALGWLDRNGIIKCMLLAILFFAADWISRYAYWSLYPRP